MRLLGEIWGNRNNIFFSLYVVAISTMIHINDLYKTKSACNVWYHWICCCWVGENYPKSKIVFVLEICIHLRNVIFRPISSVCGFRARLPTYFHSSHNVHCKWFEVTINRSLNVSPKCQAFFLEDLVSLTKMI